MSMSNMLGKLIMAGLVAKGVSMAGGKSGGGGAEKQGGDIGDIPGSFMGDPRQAYNHIHQQAGAPVIYGQENISGSF